MYWEPISRTFVFYTGDLEYGLRLEFKTEASLLIPKWLYGQNHLDFTLCYVSELHGGTFLPASQMNIAREAVSS